jgi:hypothetical protein
VIEVNKILSGALVMLIVVEVVWEGEAGRGGGFDLVTRPRLETVCRMDFNTDLRVARAGVGLRGAMVVLSMGWLVEYADEGEDE